LRRPFLEVVIGLVDFLAENGRCGHEILHEVSSSLSLS
jgi:hypothetical protein